MNVRFVEWKPEALRECDLPAGVRYKYKRHLRDQEYLKCRDGQCVITQSGYAPSAQVATAASEFEVEILDWPSWCRPRPETNAKPTWGQIIDGAPRGSSLLWRDTLGRYLADSPDDYFRCDSEPIWTFLGYLIIED